MQVVKRIFRYLEFTPEFGLCYSADSSLVLVGFSDADFGGCRLDRKWTSGTCQFLGTSLVSWSSRKQASVVLSSTDILTKPLEQDTFARLRGELGVCYPF